MELYEILLEAKSRDDYVGNSGWFAIRVAEKRPFFRALSSPTVTQNYSSWDLEFQVLDCLYGNLVLESLVVYVVA